MVREIGSDFEFPVRSLIGHRQSGGPAFEAPGTVFLASGRDALHWIIRSLGLPPGAQVLLPAYLCEDVLKPFLSFGMKVEFYGLTSGLQLDQADLAKKISSDTRVLLYIHYFGFPFDATPDLLGEFRSQTIVIEDSSHAFLSQLDHLRLESDVQFASLRKLLPVLDGAIVNSREGALTDIVPSRTRISIGYLAAVALRGAGAMLKSLWLRRPGVFPKRAFRRLFSWSGKLLDRYPRPAPMSALSRHLLDRMDVEGVIRTRRRNFQYLLEGLASGVEPRPLYQMLPEGVCPLGFPVLAEDRDELARRLIEHGVYPPVHWKLPPAVRRDEFPEAWAVSDHILTIPIDQRYDLDDMARVLDLIRSYEPAKVRWPVGR